MIYHRISNWDDAYTNGAYIAGGERWPDAWVEPATAFRAAAAAGERAKLDLPYGDKPRNRFDLFAPAGAPKGLVVFIHGGFWLRFDKSYWSHLARGAVESGFAVAMPSYTLCPQIRISGIVREIGAAIETGGRHGRRPDPPDRPFGRRASGCPHDLDDLSPAAEPAPADRQRRIDLRRSRSSPDVEDSDERHAGAGLCRGDGRKPGPARADRAAAASPAGSAARNAPNSCARMRCSPMPGPGSAPRPPPSRNPTAIITTSLTGWPIRPIP